ncbi:hypothetical protein HZA86_01720 [Candidatus Uhrbacteria bacterium]|nr:hypothetical protein [Candidatus Uhrbacteria bacterium]
MKRILKLFLLLVIVVGGGAVAVLGYTGALPSVSRLLGTNTARNLEVEFSQSDLQSARSKSGIDFQILPPTATPQQSLKFSGKKIIRATFTDKELTALLQNNRWKFNVIDNGQIKINASGTQEISGVLRTERIPGYLIAHGVPEKTVQTIEQSLSSLSSNPPFDIQLNASWKNNRLAMDVQRVEIGRIPLPQNLVDAYEPQIRSAVEQFVLSVPGVSINSLTFANGAMQTDSTFPSMVAWSEQ